MENFQSASWPHSHASLDFSLLLRTNMSLLTRITPLPFEKHNNNNVGSQIPTTEVSLEKKITVMSDFMHLWWRHVCRLDMELPWQLRWC